MNFLAHPSIVGKIMQATRSARPLCQPSRHPLSLWLLLQTSAHDIAGYGSGGFVMTQARYFALANARVP
jgi:hypothetical protein